MDTVDNTVANEKNDTLGEKLLIEKEKRLVETLTHRITSQEKETLGYTRKKHLDTGSGQHTG